MLVLAATPVMGMAPPAVAATSSLGSFTNIELVDDTVASSVYSVFASGSTVYAGTWAKGLFISTDGGHTFPINKTVKDGLGSGRVVGVYAVGKAVYVATNKGLGISKDGGKTFVNRTTANGLGSDSVQQVTVTDKAIYAATFGGLSISTDGGETFTNRTKEVNGLASNSLCEVFVDGDNIYVSTFGYGLSISTDGGDTFTTRTKEANGLLSNTVWSSYVNDGTIYSVSLGLNKSTDGGETFSTVTSGVNTLNVYATGSTIYLGTSEGFKISTNGGETFTTRTTEDGLGANWVNGFFVDGKVVYAATNGGLSIAAEGTAVSVTAGSPTAITSGAKTPTISYTTSPATAASDWTVKPTCAVYASSDTWFDTALTGTLTPGTYVTHCSGGTSSTYTPTTWLNGTLTVNAAAPSVARSVEVSPRNSSVLVSWEAPSSTGGAAITGYLVTASPKVGGSDKTCTATAAQRSCTVTGLTNGTAFTFKVKSTNGAGMVSTTAASESVTAGAPTQPRSLSVTFPNKGEATVKWQAPQFSGSGAVTSYQVRWCQESGCIRTATSLSASRSALTKNKFYWVEVRAINGSGLGPIARLEWKQGK